MNRTTVAFALIALLIATQVALAAMAPGYAAAKLTRIDAVLPLIACLAVPAGLGLVLWPWLGTMAPTKRALALMIAAGAVMRLVWFGVPPPLEDDFYRYLWDGAVLASGGNPYAMAPAAITSAITPLAVPGAHVLTHINHPELTTIYPGVAALLFALASLVARFDVDALRAVLLLADAATLILLMVLLARAGASPLSAALYWLNPLVVHAGAATVHMDVLLVPFLLGCLLAVTSGRPVIAAVLLAGAVGVKLWPVLLAPLIFAQIARTTPRRLIPAALAFAVLTAAATAPLAFAAVQASSGLTAYAGTWHNNNAPYAWASYGLYLIAGENDAAQRALRAAVAGVVALIAVATALRPVASTKELAGRLTLVSAALFYLSPAQFPWYALWFLPFAVLSGNTALLAASATLPAYYLFLPLWESGRGPAFSYGAAFIHAAPVWALLIWPYLRCRAEPGDRVAMRSA